MSASDVEAAILGLLADRAPQATICPSDAARVLWGEDFRDHMDEVRQVAFRLVDDGRLEVTQHGEVVDGPSARGPIRLRLRRD